MVNNDIPDTQDPKHTKIVTRTVIDGGESSIRTESYYEQLAHTQVDVEKRILTSRTNLMKDLLSCLDVISKNLSREVTIKVVVGKDLQPHMITKQYTVFRQEGKRKPSTK